MLYTVHEYIKYTTAEGWKWIHGPPEGREVIVEGRILRTLPGVADILLFRVVGMINAFIPNRARRGTNKRGVISQSLLVGRGADLKGCVDRL